MDRMTFHAFTQFGWSDGNHGLWRDPTLVSTRNLDETDFWIDLARTAERGRLDSIFFADAVGMGGYSAENLAAEMREGRLLLWDPSVLLPVLSKFTTDLGFVFTSSILQSHPFAFARRASTLDHLTGGRVGWNIVTSYSPNAARNFDLGELPGRGERYAWAQEYVDATYALWEGSWEEDALAKDAKAGDFVDPQKVHTVDYRSARYKIQGPHLTSPTPQRTPLLLQAGGSVPGRAFAARNAEVQFLARNTDEKLRATIADVREQATAAGRHPDDMTFVISAQFIVGRTDEEAQDRLAARMAAVDLDDQLASLGTDIGVDMTTIDPNAPVTVLREAASGSGGMSAWLDALFDGLPTGRTPTIIEALARTQGYVVGSPDEVANTIQHWYDLGIRGVAVGMDRRPGDLEDFVDLVIPELQERGLAQREYTNGTLRHKVMGYGDRLPPSHPAARCRRH